MINIALGFVKDELKTIDVPYNFMRWASPVKDRYWVGEYSETPTDTEDGYEEGIIILTGTTQKEWDALMQDRSKIKNHFPSIGGLLKDTDNGTVIIYYDNSFPVRTGEANLKRIQINLKFKAWKKKGA